MTKVEFKLTLVIAVLLMNANDLFGQVDYDIAVMGTDQISAEQFELEYSERLDQLAISHGQDMEKYNVEREQLARELKEAGNFAFTNVRLFKSYIGNISFIIDVVEKNDAERRLNFREISYQHFSDPDQLIAKWNEYETISYELFKNDQINDMECPVYHCTWSFNHSELEPFLIHFQEFVPPNQDLLARILNRSDSASFRAASTYLLAHADTSPQTLVEILSPAVRDPDSRVRNGSMRVIYYVVRAYEDIELNMDLIIDAMGYPSFTDRNKALVILRSVQLEDLTKEQRTRLAPMLLEILEKRDAHNYHNAYRVITKMSGLDYAVEDIESWREWVEQLQEGE